MGKKRGRGQRLQVTADTHTTLRAEIQSDMIAKMNLPLAAVQDLDSYNFWRGLELTDGGNKMDWCMWPVRIAQRLTSEASTPQVNASTGLVVCPRAQFLSFCLPCR